MSSHDGCSHSCVQGSCLRDELVTASPPPHDLLSRGTSCIHSHTLASLSIFDNYVTFTFEMTNIHIFGGLNECPVDKTLIISCLYGSTGLHKSLAKVTPILIPHISVTTDSIFIKLEIKNYQLNGTQLANLHLNLTMWFVSANTQSATVRILCLSFFLVS